MTYMKNAFHNLKNIIVVYDYCYINGGAAKVAIESACALADNPEINIYYFGAVGPVCTELKNSKVSVKCLNMKDINTGSRLMAMKNGIWNSNAKKIFVEYLKAFDPMDTVIHVHGWAKALSSSIINITKKKGYTCFVTLHDYFCVCPNGGFYNYKEKVLCKIPPMSIRCIACNCDKRSYAQKIWRVLRQFVQDYNVRRNKDIIYISISELNERLVYPHVRSKKFCRITNLIDIKECNKELKAGIDSNNFICVGRISEEKGTELFCTAITELMEELDIKGTVIGNGALLDEFKTRFSKIDFVGWKSMDEVAAYMQAARALVFPSKCYEGAPLTIVEALCNSLPCIVSDCTSAVELIHDDENGFIFKTNNINDLKSKIIEAMSDEKILRMRNNITKTFHPRQYSKENHTNRLIDLYDRILTQRRGE